MDALSNQPELASATKRLVQRFLVVCENRLQLLMVEAEEERQQIFLAVWLAVGAIAFVLLAGVALTALVAMALWNHSPAIALLVLTGLYATAATIFYRRLVRLYRNWQSLPATLDQLRKDRELLEKNII
jgi:uncharacterized membrane protein YqjE